MVHNPFDQIRHLNFTPIIETVSDAGTPYTGQKRFGTAALLLMTGVVLFGALLRIDGIGRPIWVDEAQTLKWSQRSCHRIVQENTTPLMPLIAKAMAELCKADSIPDEAIVRIPSMVWGNLTLVAMFLYMFKRAGLGAAFISTLYLATSRCHIYYSLEARYYAFQILVSLLYFIFLDRYLLLHKKRDLVAVCLLMTFGLLNHLSFIFLIAATQTTAMGWILLRTNAPWKKRFAETVVLAAVTTLSCLPLAALHPGTAISTIAQFKPAGFSEENQSSVKAGEKTGETYQLTPREYKSFLMDNRDFLMLSTKPQAAVFMVLLGAGALAAWMICGSLGLLMLAVLVLLPMPLFLFTVNHQWSPRYFTTQLPIFAMLIGFGCVSLRIFYEKWGGTNPARAALFLCVPLLLAVAIVIPARLRQYPKRFEDVNHLNAAETLGFLSSEMQTGDTAIITPNRSGWWFNGIMFYYLSPASGKGPKLPPGARIRYHIHLETLKKAIQSAKSSENLWILAPHRSSGEMTQLLQGAGAKIVFATKLTDVWARGRDTINMLPDGDFEHTMLRYPVPEGMEIIAGPESWQNGRSFKMTTADSGKDDKREPPIVWFPVVRSGMDGTPAADLMDRDTYTLSFRLKCAGIQTGGKSENTVRVLLDSEKGVQNLLCIQNQEEWKPFCETTFDEGAPEWKRYALSIEPGRNVLSGMKNAKIGFANFGDSGTFWLDDIQLERGAPLSPFTLDIRKAKQP